jgi:hypothetical protein
MKTRTVLPLGAAVLPPPEDSAGFQSQGRETSTDTTATQAGSTAYVTGTIIIGGCLYKGDVLSPRGYLDFSLSSMDSSSSSFVDLSL